MSSHGSDSPSREHAKSEPSTPPPQPVKAPPPGSTEASDPQPSSKDLDALHYVLAGKLYEFAEIYPKHDDQTQATDEQASDKSGNHAAGSQSVSRRSSAAASGSAADAQDEKDASADGKPSADKEAADDNAGEEPPAERARAMLSMNHSVDGLHGSLLFFAAYHRRVGILKHMATYHEAFIEVAAPVMFRLLALLRYNAVLALLRVAPTITQQRDPSIANGTLLHAACLRQRPNPDFIRDLLDTKAFRNINVEDDRGWTPLHTLAARSTGTEGRSVARLLLSRGANRSHQAQDGRTPLQHCRNPQVRTVLAESSQSAKSRKLPDLDETTRSEIDNSSIQKLPPLKPIATPTPSPTPDDSSYRERSMTPGPGGHSPKKRKAVKKLTGERMETMVQRLYSDQTSQKERWIQEQSAKLAQHDESLRKVAAPEEVEETVARLYDSELAVRESRRAQVLAKYIPEPTEEEVAKHQRSPEEIAAAVARLTAGAVQHKNAALAKLAERYTPEPESYRLSKEQQSAVASRLHDACEAKSRETTAKLADKYLQRERGRFSGSTKLTKDGWKAMGDRLCSKSS